MPAFGATQEARAMEMTPARIAIAYGIVAGAWILFSDAIVAVLPLPAGTGAWLSVAKGWGFVVVTAAILYLLVRRLAHDIRAERGATIRAEERLGEVAASLSLALAAQDAVLGATAEAELLAAVCEALVSDPRIRCAWFGLARPDGSVEMVARAGEDRGYLDDLAVRWDDDPRGRGPTGTAIRSGLAVVVDDLATDDRVGPWRPRMLDAGFGSSAAVPVTHDGDPLGVLNVYAVAKRAFIGRALADLERVAAEAGYALGAIAARRERDAAARLELDASRRASAEAQRYARLVAESPLSIVVTDLDATVLEWNPAAERLWGLPADRAIGTFAPWILPDERPTYLALVRRIAEGFRPAGAIRARHRSDGQEVIVRVANAPIVDADGAVRIL
ncbi:MAG: GAF domain-containing protein, partial [Chloroflexi bacterium]|nr:GAF domain-containing protein [Chloroflexota bacterium]